MQNQISSGFMLFHGGGIEVEMKKIRVLVAGGFRSFRDLLAHELNRDTGLEAAAAAADPLESKELIEKYRPDVILLALESSGFGGVDFLRKLLARFVIPVVVISPWKEMISELLSAGAADVILKPSGVTPEELEDFVARELAVKVKLASMGRQGRENLNPSVHYPVLGGYPKNCVIAIGASTGGTEAIFKVVSGFERDIPGVVVVQHMPPGFTQMYAERLNTQCKIDAKEAETGDLVLPGRVLIAPGDAHMRLISVGGNYQVECKTGAKVSGHCPSVDVLFESVAKAAGSKAIGILLTGMGADGAKGLLSMRTAGAETIGQDKESCIVYGMPKEAYLMGGVKYQLGLEKIAEKVYQLLNSLKR